MNTSAVVLFCVHAMTVLAVIGIIFAQRKEPASRFAWVLVLVFLPVAGIALYLLLGHNYTRKVRIELSENTWREVHAHIQEQIDNSGRMEFADRRYTQLARMNLINDQSPVTSDNRVDIFNNGREKFERLLEDIRAAEKYVHMLYFIFRTDDLGNAILDLLAEKAAQGLDVRLVYDDLGNIAVSDRGFKKLRQAGGRVYRYSPLMTSWFSANYRNHRKLVIIDGRIGYIGGMNVGVEYVEGKKKLRPWRDTHLRLEGSAVQVMEGAFLPDYVYASKKHHQQDDLSHFFDFSQRFDGSQTVQILTSGPQVGKYNIHHAYAKLIASARDYLYIQTPYLIPDKTILDALSIAVASGVDVRIMIPLHPDKYFVYLASLSYARLLCSLGVKIYLYQGFIHSKVVFADDQALSIGSANLDIRSFFLSYEANAIIFDKQLTSSQKEQFGRDMENSLLADTAYFNAFSPPLRLMLPLCQLFSPLL